MERVELVMTTEIKEKARKYAKQKGLSLSALIRYSILNEIES